MSTTENDPRPSPQEYGYASDEAVLMTFQTLVRTAYRRGKKMQWGDLPDSLRRYNEALLAWHERTGVPYETDAEYRAKITKGGQ